MKTIPKSLHTITVLVKLAQIYIDGGHARELAIGLALGALDYDGAPDVYELAAKARAILAKQVQS